MKIALLIFIVAGITFLGCSENFDNTLVSTSIQTEKLTNPLNSKSIISSEIDIKDPSINPFIIVSGSINGLTGGELVIDTTYVNYQGRLLYVYARINVLEFTFPGTTEFTIKLHPEEALIQLFPHMVFDIPVRVTAWFQGVDLKEMGYNKTGHVDFAFFDDDGSIELIPAQQTHVNTDTQTIKVLNAQMLHFSRYGWIRGQQ